MPLVNFNKQFAEKVRLGEKQQTIRSLRKRSFKEGDILYLYTGLRTKNCKLLGEGKCNLVWKIEIWIDEDLSDNVVLVNGCFPTNELLEDIALRDGFGSVDEMLGWFSTTHKFPFYGQLIRWGK